MMRVWKKPVVVFYKQRFQEPERRAFAVVKARRLQIVASEREKARNSGAVYSTSFLSWRYVLCWFDDHEDDFGKASRRPTGLMFHDRITFSTDEKGKTNLQCQFQGGTWRTGLALQLIPR